jgi:ribosomal protein S18 acetylase RimI-like enzyme
MARIRAARPADEATLLGMLPLLADFPVPNWRTARQVADADLKILVQALRHPEPECSIFVGEEPEGVVAGFVFSTTRQDYFTGKPHAHIEVLTVLDSARGKGVARSLIEAAENWARERGYSNVTLNVFANNTRASGVYHRLGYSPETVHYIKPLDLQATRGEDLP